MKKVIAAAAGLMLVGTMVGTAGAAVSLSGDARARWYYEQYSDATDATENDEKFSSRVRVKFKAEAKGGAYAVARLRMSDAVWDGTNATRAKGEGSNLYTDYAYIGIPMGPVTVEAGLMPVNYTKFSIWDRRMDMFRVKWANDMTEVAFDYVKAAEYTDPATDTIDDNDQNWMNVYVSQKFAGDWAIRGQLLYFDDQVGDSDGFQAFARVEGAAGPVALEAEYVWLSDDTVEPDGGWGTYVQASMNFGATSLAVNGGYIKDQLMADDDFGFIMIGGASAITPSVTENVGALGDTMWLGGIMGFKVTEDLSLKGILVYADIDTSGTNDITAFEVSGSLTYAISDGAAFDWVVGYLNLDDDAGALENPFGTAVTLSLSF